MKFYRNNKTNAKGSHGFTMAELLIVVAIIAVLVAIAIPVFRNQTERAREAYDIYTMRQAATAAIELCYAGITDRASAISAGLSWWGAEGESNANAWGAYDPASGKFYPKKTDIKKAYGKGTAINGGTVYTLGNDRGAYGAAEDYTDGIIMIAIYPYGSNRHIDVYWKHKTGDAYIGGQYKLSDPKYSIRVSLE